MSSSTLEDHRSLNQKNSKKMVYLNRSNFQAHPFHLVSPSPWPIFTSFTLLALTTSGVLFLHAFKVASFFLLFAFFNLLASMTFWFRDVISEGIFEYILHYNDIKFLDYIKKKFCKRKWYIV